MLTWFVGAAGVSLALHVLGVNVVPLVTFGSASTFIIGLASQQLLSNAITGVSIVRQRPPAAGGGGWRGGGWGPACLHLQP
jgi:small-conductance mechanosensitive channel